MHPFSYVVWPAGPVTEELFVAQPLMVTEENFDSKVLQSPLAAIAFAWAPWCPTCRTSMPMIDEYAKDEKGEDPSG